MQHVNPCGFDTFEWDILKLSAILEQIRQRRYCEAWWPLGRSAVSVGVALWSRRRNVERWVAEVISV